MVIEIHIVAALVAVVLGAVQFAMAKGTGLHRGIGRVWFLAMVIVCATSMGIYEINDGKPSPIHLLTAITIIAMTIASVAAKRGNIRRHKRALIGCYTGLIIAGLAATLIPARHIPQLLGF